MTQNIHTGSIKALIFPLRTCLVQKINKCPAPESFQEDLLFPSLIFIPRTCLLLVFSVLSDGANIDNFMETRCSTCT